MGSTKKDKKKIKKNVEIPVEKVVQEVSVEAPPQEPTRLSTLFPDHLLALETIGRDVENCRLAMALQEQYLSNLRLQVKLLDASIKKQEQEVYAKAQAYEAEKQKYVAFKKSIFPIYGFKEDEGMGYDPISGKIKRD